MGGWVLLTVSLQPHAAASPCGYSLSLSYNPCYPPKQTRTAGGEFGYKIRSFRPGDLEGVREVFAMTRKAPGERSPAVAKMTRSILKTDLADPVAVYGEGRFWVAERLGGGGVLGCVGLRVATEGTRRVGEVVRLAVDEGCRGQGVGKALLLTAEEAAVKAGVQALRATTIDALETASMLYRSSGYVVVGSQAYGKEGSGGQILQYLKETEANS